MVTVPYRIVESQVDWLTCTTPSSFTDDRLLNLGEVVAQSEARTDPTICEWHWRGYQGTRGKHFAYGARFDSHILQLSSDLAAKWFAEAHYRATTVTRIDLAVTVYYDGGKEGVARDGYSEGLQQQRKGGRIADRALIVNSHGGSTYYLGCRTSDLFARVYDKWRESREERYRHCWRWEVEFKGDVANRVAGRLAASIDRERDCADIVRTHFERRGNRADWMASCGELRISASRRPSGVASRLNWLDSSVAPVIAKLLPLVSEEEICRALGLNPEAIERSRIRYDSAFDGHTLAEGGEAGPTEQSN